ncbi:MAG TPA: hypothetical protein PLG04_00375 [Anaerolineaceae bacterium]|nr:hypothetical protein [Anaerolineaceae bacterium]
MVRNEIKGIIADIIEDMGMGKQYGVVMVGVVMPDFPHLDIPVNTPEQGVELARRIHSVTGLTTNARLASHSGIKYARFPKKEEAN